MRTDDHRQPAGRDARTLARRAAASTRAALPLAALAVTGATLALGALALPGGDDILTRNIATALSGAPAGTVAPGSGREQALLLPSRLEAEPPSAFGHGFAVGDRITISGNGGEARVLEVADVREIAPALTLTEAADSPRLLMVTCYALSPSTGDRLAAPVRFVISAERPAPALAAPATRGLRNAL